MLMRELMREHGGGVINYLLVVINEYGFHLQIN